MYLIFINFLFPKKYLQKPPRPPSPKKQHQANQPLPLLKCPRFLIPFIRIARWYISIPKFAVLVYFERPWYGNFRNGIFVVFWYTLGIFLICQIKNKIHKNNIKIITIVAIIIGIIWKHCRFSAKNIFILSDYSCMSNSGEGDLIFREEKVTLSMAELIF